MANATRQIDNTQTIVPRSKRLRSKSSNDVSSHNSVDWLNVVLNEVDEDPSLEAWNFFFQNSPSHVSRLKTQNSEITFPIPYIFKPVNPAQNLANSIESNNSQRKQQSLSSNFSSFSTNLLPEDLVGKVVEVLGIVLDEVKADIWRTMIKGDKGKK